MISNQSSVATGKVCWLILFSIAMGYLEAAVVVYLRDIYYVSGFAFPLVPIHPRDLITELGREAATLIMLVGVGILGGRTKLQKVAFFLIAFGVWDVFYYVFLKLILGWPASLLTWDILFLLPFPWVGPVLCPVLLSFTMILLGTVFLRQENKHRAFKVSAGYWAWFIAGSLIVITSFCLDPLRHLAAFRADAMQPYRPGKFDWWLFALGEALLLVGVLRLIRRVKYPEAEQAARDHEG